MTFDFHTPPEWADWKDESDKYQDPPLLGHDIVHIPSPPPLGKLIAHTPNPILDHYRHIDSPDQPHPDHVAVRWPRRLFRLLVCIVIVSLFLRWVHPQWWENVCYTMDIAWREGWMHGW